MRTSSKILLAVVIVAVAVLIALSTRHPSLSPEQEIAAQTDSAVAAANRHNVSGIMAVVSAQYHDENGFNNDLLHTLLIRAMRGNPTDSITMSGSNITVQGDTATSQGYLIVQDTQNGRTLYSQEVSLHWQKEPARSFLVFPSHAWRIVSASYGPFGAEADFGI